MAMVFSRSSSYGRGCGHHKGTHIPKQDYHECQLLPCRHPTITDTPITWTAVKSQELLNYRYLTEINSHCYGLSLMRTQTQGPYVKGVDCNSLPHQYPRSRFCLVTHLRHTTLLPNNKVLYSWLASFGQNMKDNLWLFSFTLVQKY